MNNDTKQIDDGGPAFPLPAGTQRVKRWQPGVGEYEVSEAVASQGLSIRDYFAAHAPPAPAEFESDSCPKPIRPIGVDSAFSNDRLRRLVSDYRRDPCFDLESCGETENERAALRDFSDAQDEYAAACHNWRNANAIAREIEWRWHWADAMLKARLP